MTDYPLVLIHWIDSRGASSQWAFLDDKAQGPCQCESAGWLIHQSPDSIVICPHIGDTGDEWEDAQGCGIMEIPTVAITSIHKLTKGKRVPSEKTQGGAP